jgi:hypothetical protein
MDLVEEGTAHRSAHINASNAGEALGVEGSMLNGGDEQVSDHEDENEEDAGMGGNDMHPWKRP